MVKTRSLITFTALFSPRKRGLEESVEEGCRCLGKTYNLIRRLAVVFEIKLGLRAAILPVGEALQLAPPQALSGECCPPDGDAHARRLPGDSPFLGDRPG